MGRKQTTQHVLEELPVPGDGQCVAKVVENRGGGNYVVQVPAEVNWTDEPTLLVSLPSKFRKLIWVKRGSFVIIQREEGKTKIAGEIVHVLFLDHIKHLKAQGIWPAEFEPNPPSAKDGESDESQSDDEENDDDLFVNPNRQYDEDDDDDDDE
ncbi:uncharacterized protein SPPG_06633 [Spizellomyces punctatus DAOM BR117]|uniref:S1-like domain-containing protein n=1 Tax=Spizellomyces punctatus (strain DAOM BR117) TaxID=645134 RepID=A0A0L0HBV8_SPIPD|nr:uncharacterized protein SPPG_06633 [Spizellomyces punctatus DAOM BR117]KNC98233.1 hypothetical protein SPPG_06633 [Spizellomyces punctatus DAOM BR117]|eukprot:XP_016606273.1 hypothetical protein SPPG_06633 [Spizellomyces punctatus DAOM BR117]